MKRLTFSLFIFLCLNSVAHPNIATKEYSKELAHYPSPLPDRVVLTWNDDPATTQAVNWRTDISVKATNLINTTYESMMRGIKILKPGKRLGDIGYEIQSYVEEKGYSVVRDFCGHGISNIFHEPPNILHYGKKNSGVELRPGMTFTIEPMINDGKYDVKVLNDGWTAVTKDKSLSAQFEHTIGITEDSYEIFTESVKGYKGPPYKI